jgi:hypothetical protein
MAGAQSNRRLLEIYVGVSAGRLEAEGVDRGRERPRWRGDSRELFYTLPLPNSLKMVAAV